MFDELDDNSKLNNQQSDKRADYNINLLSSQAQKRQRKFSLKKKVKPAQLPMHELEGKKSSPAVAAPKKIKPKKNLGQFFTSLFKSFKPPAPPVKAKDENKDPDKLAHTLDYTTQNNLTVNTQGEKKADVDFKPSPPFTTEHVEATISAVPGHFKESKDKDKEQSAKAEAITFSQAREIKGHKHKESNEDLDTEVNLLPDKTRRLDPNQMIASYILVLAICVVAVVGPYLLYIIKDQEYKKENQTLQEQIALIQEKIVARQEQIESFGDLSYKLNNLEKLFKDHIYWSQFFPILEKTTSQGVYFTSLTVGNDYKITLSGEAINLRSAAEQLVIFQNSREYLDVELQKLSMPKTGAESNKSHLDISFSLGLDDSIVHEQTE